MALGMPTSTVVSAIGQCWVPANSSMPERRPRTLKHGDTFAVFDPTGDVLSGAMSADGLYYRDTRHLSHLDLSIAGVRPMLLSSTLRDDNATLTCDLTNPDLCDADGRLILEHDLVHIRRTKFLWNATCFERLSLNNFGDRDVHLSLDIRLEADFADVFEVRGMRRPARGRFLAPRLTRDGITFVYRGLDGIERTTTVRFDPTPARLQADRAAYRLTLAPDTRSLIFVEISCLSAYPTRDPREHYLGSLAELRRSARRSFSRAASVTTSNEHFNSTLRRSVSDLYMLVTETNQGPFPYAGIPWFSAAFGRDAIITGLQTLWMDPELSAGVLKYLAAHQATHVDPASDAEPGKILHEVRHGEMANLGEVPFKHYYGSVDSTPLFIMLAGAYLKRTRDVGLIRCLWPNIEAALGWIERYGDRDGDGLIEYGSRTAKGLVNQGWKDSHDSIFHADGTMAHGPIAVCEVQGYAYAAKCAAAAIAEELGLLDRAIALNREADLLRRRFDETFWCEDIGTYALALDGSKRPCRVRSSNAGHALFSGIALPDRIKAICTTLMAPESFSGWGIRTIANSESRYNPMSYHNGSVWPHDNALIALGLARYGYKREAARILDGLFAASLYTDHNRLPELFCGFGRRRGQGPTLYPVACVPQAWAAAAPFSLIQACLGLDLDPNRRTLHMERPVLPAFMTDLTVRNLSIDGASVDIVLQKAESGEVAAHVLNRTGDIRVEIAT